MYKTVEVLEKSKIVLKLNLLELIEGENVKAIKLEAYSYLVDGSLLYVNEVWRVESYRYSYHWQTKEGKMLLRWDNAPHWKQLKTYPHHKHLGKKILPSVQPLVEEIIAEIEKMILRR